MSEPIKMLVKIECPHCKKEMLVGMENYAPEFKEIFTVEDVEKSKKTILDKLENAYEKDVITKGTLNSAKEWVMADTTMFGPSDIDSVFESIINKE